MAESSGAASPSAPQAAPADSVPSDPNGSTDPSQSQPLSSDPTVNNDSNPDAADLQKQEEMSLEAEINNTSSTQPDTSPAEPSTAPSQAQAAANNAVPSPTTHPAVLEPRIPTKKDASLREFLRKTDDYAPLIPDAVTDYYLTVAGLPPPPETDRRLARLLALATQKFIADIAADAYQYSRIRSTNTTSNNPMTGLGGAAGFGTGGGGGGGDDGPGGAKGKREAGKTQTLGGPRAGYGGGGAGAGGQGRTVLTMEDLGMAMGEYGINVKRGEFYR